MINKPIINKSIINKDAINKSMIILLLMMSAYSQKSMAQCHSNKNELSAQYQVSNDNLQGKIARQQVTLLRHKNDIVYQYHNQEMSEYWHQQKNGLITLTRYFDHDKQGIAYQAGEIKSKQSWQQINELISPTLREKMQLLSSRENACQVEQKFQLIDGKNEILLTWMPQLNLVKHLTIITPTQIKQWQLLELTTSSEKIAEQFMQWQHYKTTDYADVGDNEDDPFLAKMINLGFVEHAASGFYRADGGVFK